MFFFGWSIHRGGSNAINIQYVLISYCWLSLLLRVVDALHPNEVSMGTTILAIRYKDGVVVGADTRTSVSGYVSNRYAVSGLRMRYMHFVIIIASISQSFLIIYSSTGQTYICVG